MNKLKKSSMLVLSLQYRNLMGVSGEHPNMVSAGQRGPSTTWERGIFSAKRQDIRVLQRHILSCLDEFFAEHGLPELLSDFLFGQFLPASKSSNQ
jgi:hypothetical protein